MADAPDKLELVVARQKSFDRRLRRIEDDVDDFRQRMFLQESGLANESSHRIRHEGTIGELHAELDRRLRAREMIRDDSNDQ